MFESTRFCSLGVSTKFQVVQTEKGDESAGSSQPTCAMTDVYRAQHPQKAAQHFAIITGIGLKNTPVRQKDVVTCLFPNG